MRRTSSLSPVLPGMMAVSPELSGLVATSRKSRRRPPLTFFASGPWQAEQFSEEQRTDLAIEVDLGRGGRGGSHRQAASQQRPALIGSFRARLHAC